MAKYKKWDDRKSDEVTANNDTLMKEKLSGIYGKMKAYCLRFAGLLHLADKAYDGAKFENEEIITETTMDRAVELADYFFEAAQNITERVTKTVIASPDVIRFASYMKAGYSFQRIGDLEFPDVKSGDARRTRAARIVKKMILEYPKIFGAEVK